MSPAAALHAQLASIVEVLANTAVAEICELVDSGYSVLQLELNRSRKENEALRRKLRLTELRAARGAALRAAAAAAAPLPRPPLPRPPRQSLPLPQLPPPPPPAHQRRRSGSPGGEALPSNQEALRCREPAPSSGPGQDAARGPPAAGEPTVALTAAPGAVIKVEAEDEPWSGPEPWTRPLQDGDFGPVSTETEAPPPLPKQEAAEEPDGPSQAWVIGEVSSTSASVPQTLNAAQRPDASGYDRLMFDPQLQRGPLTTQNALGEDPGCSYALNTGVSISAASDSGGGGGFPFPVCEASQHQRPADETRRPARKEPPERAGAFVRRDRWRLQDGVVREDGGGRTFVCTCCGKTLACLKNLKTHMRVHTGEKPFVCALCGKRFSDSSNLKRHQSVHTGEKRYGCLHCGKRFAQSGSLKVHMSVHTDCKQFRCSFCGKTFISGSHLRRHVTVHAAEKRFAPAFQ